VPAGAENLFMAVTGERPAGLLVSVPFEDLFLAARL